MKGHTCPLCNGGTRVIDTRKCNYADARAVRRRRVCEKCEHRFSTIELDVEDLKRTERQLKRLLRILMPLSNYQEDLTRMAKIAAALAPLGGIFNDH